MFVFCVLTSKEKRNGKYIGKYVQKQPKSLRLSSHASNWKTGEAFNVPIFFSNNVDKH